ncbi:hypothetical protein [Enterococcus crotali]|uniref:hypothetical protein n=1 Tax=Enterococcus crotali TaxID=1453587 RepID=UPI00046FEFD5|nr:hypothetical protein [Enterococcus crotali]
MKKSVKSSMVVLALSLGLSIGPSEEVEAMYESPYTYFNEYGIRQELFSDIDALHSDRYRAEMDQLMENHEKGLLSDDEFDRLSKTLAESDEEEFLERKTLFDNYGLLKKIDIKNITHFDADFEEYSSLTGLEEMTALEQIQGEGGNFNSFRELGKLKKLKRVMLEANNQLTLNSFKNLKDLEEIRLLFDGHENNEEQGSQEYTQALPTDISALSNLDKLKNIQISARGRMATITLKKGTTSYQLFDPIVSSKQFDGAKMNYSSDSESNEWLEWNNLKGDEKYLGFSWRIENGPNFSYIGEGQIPIRWK